MAPNALKFLNGNGRTMALALSNKINSCSSGGRCCRIISLVADNTSITQQTRIGMATGAGLATLFLLKTAILLNDSYAYGRLAMPPLYDDVSYFVDAMQRVEVFRSQGLRGVVAGLISAPPHSPYSTLAAFVAFLVSGGSRAAPYVMNSLAIVALTLLWIVMFRVGAITAWLIVILVTTTGWFDNAVTIYHPDLIAGYAAAIVASFAIFQHEVLSTMRRVVCAGVLGGAVLLIKPTALAMVLTLWAVAFCAGLVASRAAGVPIFTSLRRLSIFGLLVVFVSGPYFYSQLSTLFSYIYTAFVTQHNTWIHLSTGANPSTFFLAKTVELFGIWLFLGAGALVVLVVAAGRLRQPPIIYLAGLLACLFVAYIVPTLVPIQVMLYGSVLYGMVLVTGVVVLTHLPLLASPTWQAIAVRPKRQVLFGSFLLLAFGGVASLETADRQLRFSFANITTYSSEFDRVYNILRDMAKPSGGEAGSPHRISAYFPTVGIPPHAYRFRGLQEGLDIFVDLDGPLETDPNRVLSAARTADIVLIPDEHRLAKYFPYPVNALLGGVVQKLRLDTAMIEDPPVQLSEGAMLIFRHRQHEPERGQTLPANPRALTKRNQTGE